VFSSPFGFGVIASGQVEAGYAFGAGADIGAGGGIFYTPGEGFNVGGFSGGGAFIGGPNVGLESGTF